MFGRKKKIKQEEKLLNDINILLKDSTVSEKEYQILEVAKEQIEHKKYFARVLADLEGNLRPLAIKSELTKNVAKLYSSIINETYEDSGWSGIRFF